MKLDPKKTALPTFDFQKGVWGFAPGAEAIIPITQAIVLTVDAFLAEQGE